MMTEDEAKTKWCPFSRELVLHEKGTPSSNGTMCFSCIASACMAWRWHERPVEGNSTFDGKPHPGTGYCGLAGKVTP